MIARAIFAAEGDLYVMVSKRLAQLSDPDYLREHPEHRGYALAGLLVYNALTELLTEGKLELGIEITDLWLRKNSQWLKGKSPRFVQKGLLALEGILGIIRRIREHGRRVIVFLLRLRGKKKETGSPQTPLNSEENTEETTSTEKSSSSLPNSVQNQEEGEKPDHSALIARAMALPTEEPPSQEQVEWAITTFSAQWVEQALDAADRHARKPGNMRVRLWGYILRTLINWKQQGGAPPPKPRPAPPSPSKEAPKEDSSLEAEVTRNKGIWASLTEDQRNEIRAEIKAEHPSLRHSASVIEGLAIGRAAERYGMAFDSPESRPRAP